MSEEIVESNEVESNETQSNETQSNDECNDTVYYSDGYNKITSKRFIMGVNTHVLSNISSINVGVNNYAGDEGEANPIRNGMMGFGGFLLFLGFVTMMSDSWLFAIVCLLIGGGLLYKALQMDAVVGATDDWAEYGVTITTNSGEKDAVRSQDKAKIDKLIAAMNKAITENL